MKVSDIIRQHKEQILQEWIASIKKEVPEAKKHDLVALQNDVPDLLDDIAADLDAQQVDQDTHDDIEHGKLRADFDNYSLSHVIREYRLLLRTILSVIDEHSPIQLEERDKIIFLITLAIEQAAEVFFQTRQQEEKGAKEEAQAQTQALQQEGQLRDTFIETVTHDIRNPLSNITALVNLLQEKLSDNPSLHRPLEAIHTSVDRADTLIRNLLDVNLIELGGQLPIKPRQCDLMEMVRASVSFFQAQYQGTLQLVAPEPTLVGDFDDQMLRRALDNLIKNAIKYGESDGPIVITCQRSGQAIVLSVHNDGNPIAQDQLDKIFTRYYRASEQQRSQGWGIGLSLVRGIAQAHDGAVTATSDAQQGTTFTLRLPVV